MGDKRSRSYPVIGLASAVQLLVEHFGDLTSGLESRDEIGKRLGYSSGSSGNAVRKIAALSQYGFLVRRDGLYSTGYLGEELLRETLAASDLRQTLLVALRNPPLFSELLDAYQDLPRLPVDLARVLVENHGITTGASQQAAEVFLKSGEFAGVMNSDGCFLKDHGEELVDLSEILPGAQGVQKILAKDAFKPHVRRHFESITALLEGGRRADVSFDLPRDFSVRDSDDLIDQISFSLKYVVKNMQRRERISSIGRVDFSKRVR